MLSNSALRADCSAARAVRSGEPTEAAVAEAACDSLAHAGAGFQPAAVAADSLEATGAVADVGGATTSASTGRVVEPAATDASTLSPVLVNVRSPHAFSKNARRSGGTGLRSGRTATACVIS